MLIPYLVYYERITTTKQETTKRFLKQGMIKILKALERSEKNGLSFSALHNQTGLQRNVLSEYLQQLRKVKIVTQDLEATKTDNDKIKTRKYHLASPLSLESLFLNDVVDFLIEQTSNRFSNTNRIYFPLLSLDWFVVTDSSDFRECLEKILNKPETWLALNKVSSAILDEWNEFVLSKREPQDRELIVKYSKYLVEVWRLNNSIKSIAENEINLALPPELRFTVEDQKNEDKIYEVISYEWLKQNKFKIPLNSKNPPNLDMVRFLLNKRNRELYAGYWSSLGNEPKTLLSWASLGFRGYQKRLEEIFPRQRKH